MYTTIEELQADLDQWIHTYNFERTHSGKYCFGKTPMQTFLDSKHLALEKRLDELLQKDTKFDSSSKTETGSAEEQPARDNLTSRNNEEVVEQMASSFFKTENYFERNA